MNAILVGVDGSGGIDRCGALGGPDSGARGADLKIIGVYDVRTSNYARA